MARRFNYRRAKIHRTYTIAELAARVGRRPEDIVLEGVAIWEERETAHALAEFRASLDEAEASLAGGGGRLITPESMRELAEDVKRRGRARLAAQMKTAR